MKIVVVLIALALIAMINPKIALLFLPSASLPPYRALTPREISAELAQRGFKSERGKASSAASINSMLR